MVLAGITTRSFAQDYDQKHSIDLRSNVDLSHVNGLDQRAGANLANVGEDEEDDRDD